MLQRDEKRVLTAPLCSLRDGAGLFDCTPCNIVWCLMLSAGQPEAVIEPPARHSALAATPSLPATAVSVLAAPCTDAVPWRFTPNFLHGRRAAPLLAEFARLSYSANTAATLLLSAPSKGHARESGPRRGLLPLAVSHGVAFRPERPCGRLDSPSSRCHTFRPSART